MHFVLETVVFPSMLLFVFIAQSLRVCQFAPPAGAKRERVEAKNNYVVDSVPTCWLAGPVGRDPLFCQQLILRGHDFSFTKRSYWGRSRNVCLSMKKNRERWMQHNMDESRVLFSL